MTEKIIVNKFKTFFMMPFMYVKSISLKQAINIFTKSANWDRTRLELTTGEAYNELQY